MPAHGTTFNKLFGQHRQSAVRQSQSNPNSFSIKTESSDKSSDYRIILESITTI